MKEFSFMEKYLPSIPQVYFLDLEEDLMLSFCVVKLEGGIIQEHPKVLVSQVKGILEFDVILNLVIKRLCQNERRKLKSFAQQCNVSAKLFMVH